MKEKGTRIEVSPELHKTLKDLYDDLKAQGAKDLTLKKVLDDLCQAGLAYQNLPKEDLTSDSEELTGIKKPSNPHQHFIVESKRELKSMTEAVYEKESRLLKREMQLTKREEIIIDRFNKYFELKEQLDEDNVKNLLFVNGQIALKDKIKAKDKEIRDLTKENKQLLDELFASIEKIEKNTRKDVLMDEILPILTAAILGFKYFQDENDKKQNSNPKVVELLKLFVQLNPIQQAKFISDLKKEVQKSNIRFKKPE